MVDQANWVAWGVQDWVTCSLAFSSVFRFLSKSYRNSWGSRRTGRKHPAPSTDAQGPSAIRGAPVREGGICCSLKREETRGGDVDTFGEDGEKKRAEATGKRWMRVGMSTDSAHLACAAKVHSFPDLLRVARSGLPLPCRLLTYEKREEPHRL